MLLIVGVFWLVVAVVVVVSAVVVVRFLPRATAERESNPEWLDPRVVDWANELAKDEAPLDFKTYRDGTVRENVVISAAREQFVSTAVHFQDLRKIFPGLDSVLDSQPTAKGRLSTAMFFRFRCTNGVLATEAEWHRARMSVESVVHFGYACLPPHAETLRSPFSLPEFQRILAAPLVGS